MDSVDRLDRRVAPCCSAQRVGQQPITLLGGYPYKLRPLLRDATNAIPQAQTERLADGYIDRAMIVCDMGPRALVLKAS
jgi:hypothetical protein